MDMFLFLSSFPNPHLALTTDQKLGLVSELMSLLEKKNLFFKVTFWKVSKPEIYKYFFSKPNSECIIFRPFSHT